MPIKLDPYTGPSEKIIGMFSMFLFTQRPHSLGQLAKAFQCSKQTILRMIDHIERSRWLTIDSWTEGRERWYQARKMGKAPNLSLDAEAIGKLLLCRDMVWHLLPKTYRKELSTALRDAALTLGSRDEDGMLPSYTQVKPKGMIDYSARDAFITDLIRAIREHRLCRISYRGPNHPRPKTYTVAGYQIVVFHEGLYLRCRPAEFLEQQGQDKDLILAVHRMHGVTLCEDKFRPIVPAQSAQEMAGTFGLTQGERFRVCVRVSPDAAMYVSERIWSDDQKVTRKKDGSLILDFSSTSEAETLAWVLSFGGAVELLKPVELRKKIHAASGAVTRLHRPAKS